MPGKKSVNLMRSKPGPRVSPGGAGWWHHWATSEPLSKWVGGSALPAVGQVGMLSRLEEPSCLSYHHTFGSPAFCAQKHMSVDPVNCQMYIERVWGLLSCPRSHQPFCVYWVSEKGLYERAVIFFQCIFRKTNKLPSVFSFQSVQDKLMQNAL